MQQVNLTITDEDHAILIRESGKYMMETGKIKKVATLAYELLRPAIVALNDSKPDAPVPTGSIKEDKIDNKEASKNAFDFSALDI